jgi:hypothetical protein
MFKAWAGTFLVYALLRRKRCSIGPARKNGLWEVLIQLRLYCAPSVTQVASKRTHIGASGKAIELSKVRSELKGKRTNPGGSAAVCD